MNLPASSVNADPASQTAAAPGKAHELLVAVDRGSERKVVSVECSSPQA